MSGVSARASADPSRIELEVQRGADDLADAILAAVEADDPHEPLDWSADEITVVVPDFRLSYGAGDLALANRAIFQDALDAALAEFPIKDFDGCRVRRQASGFLDWILMETAEVNPNVAALGAAQASLDVVVRPGIAQALGVGSPSILWQPHATRRVGGPVIPWGRDVPDDLPLDSVLGEVTVRTAEFDRRRVPTYNLVEPYPVLDARRPKQTWYLDPVRPPMQAIRFAAKLLRDNHVRSVLALEAGHSAAAQALASWVPRATVYTDSAVLPLMDDAAFDSTLSSGKSAEGAPSRRRTGTARGLIHGNETAGAVILNLPSGRQLGALGAWVEAATESATFSTKLHRQIMASGTGSNPEVATWTVEVAADRVAPGGLLVALGDVDSGVLQLAHRHLRRQGFKPIDITKDGGYIAQFDYTRPVHDDFLAVPATGRLVSAWRAPA